MIDVYDDDSIKITSLKFSSPPIIDARGIISSLIDLSYAGERNKRDEESFINNQIGQAATNMISMTRAYQVVNNCNTPQGVKVYAENMLDQLFAHQERLNNKLGIRIESIDIKE